MAEWLWEDKILTEDDIPKDTIGFIYLIEHLPSKKYYVGKKSLYSVRNLKIGKRELQRIKEERKSKGIRGSLPKKKQVKKSSNWVDYYSSNEWIQSEVKNGNRDDFKRTILQFCYSKKALSYYEVHWLFKYDVLLDENSLNGNISGKWYRRDLE